MPESWFHLREPLTLSTIEDVVEPPRHTWSRCFPMIVRSTGGASFNMRPTWFCSVPSLDLHRSQNDGVYLYWIRPANAEYEVGGLCEGLGFCSHLVLSFVLLISFSWTRQQLNLNTRFKQLVCLSANNAREHAREHALNTPLSVFQQCPRTRPASQLGNTHNKCRSHHMHPNNMHHPLTPRTHNPNRSNTQTTCYNYPAPDTRPDLPQ